MNDAVYDNLAALISALRAEHPESNYLSASASWLNEDGAIATLTLSIGESPDVEEDADEA